MNARLVKAMHPHRRIPKRGAWPLVVALAGLLLTAGWLLDAVTREMAR